MGPSQGLEPAKERALRKREAFLASWRVRRQAGEAGADPRSGYADVLSPAPLNERAPSNGSFFVMACFLQICPIDFARQKPVWAKNAKYEYCHKNRYIS